MHHSQNRVTSSVFTITSLDLKKLDDSHDRKNHRCKRDKIKVTKVQRIQTTSRSNSPMYSKRFYSGSQVRYIFQYLCLIIRISFYRLIIYYTIHSIHRKILSIISYVNVKNDPTTVVILVYNYY